MLKKDQYIVIFILWTPAVSLYLLMVTIVLKYISKQKVTVIFDQTNLAKNYFSQSKINKFIYLFCEYLIKILLIKNYSTKQTIYKRGRTVGIENKLIESFYFDILIWKKSQSLDINKKLSKKEVKLKEKYTEANYLINKVLTTIYSHNKIDIKNFILPGGIVSTSRLWVENIRLFDCNFYTFEDGGTDRTLWARDGIAAQFPNAFEDLNFLLNSNKMIINNGLKIADKVLYSRNQCKDRGETGIELASFQKIASNKRIKIKDSEDKVIVTIFLNVSWDSATLGIHTKFKSTIEMIENLAESILSIDNLILVIRQHPIERDPVINTKDNYALLEKKIKNKYKKRFVFIKANHDINSYDLINISDLIIVHSSTIGLEAAILGKPVFTTAKCYYHKLKAIKYIDNISILKKAISKIKDKKFFKTNKKSIDSCKLVYYLTQSLYKRDTGFSPTMKIRRFMNLLVTPNSFKKMNKFLINFLILKKLADFK